MDFSTIKLIIWDLDETFWAGTLTEGGISPLPQNIGIVKESSRRGIVNSICSKNNAEPVTQELKGMGVLDFFVFSSISWEPKGARIKSLIEDMGLRPINVLFIDDNPMNLQEAKTLLPELNIAEPRILVALNEYLKSIPEKDPQLKRLSQYKLLEKKRDSKKQFASNEEFLLNSGIVVEIGKDCKNHIDRISDLVMRSNQINYTKKRSSKDELELLFDDKDLDCGYVKVKDNYGDYGLVGFFAVNKKTKSCEHLLFSCRCIGMGVEQYIYVSLGYPKVEIQGDVIVPLTQEAAPRWINSSNTDSTDQEILASSKSFSILFKGPCDLSVLTKYIEKQCEIVEEFAHGGDNGATIESHNHSVMIRNNYDQNEERQREILKDFPYLDKSLFETQIYSKKFDVICISSIVDPNFGLYKKKGSDIIIPFAEAFYPITDSKYWDKYCSGQLYFSGYKPTKEYLKHFSTIYDYVGKTTPEMFIDNLKFIMDHTAKETHFVVILGTEHPYHGELRSENWKDRHLVHRLFNEKIRSFALGAPRLHLLDFNDYVTSDDDFLGAINHYKPKVYYAMAQGLVDIVNGISGSMQVERIDSSNLRKMSFLAKIGRVKEILFNHCSLYRNAVLYYHKKVSR